MRRIIGTKWTKISWLALFSLLAMLVVYSCEQTTGPEDDTGEDWKILIYSDLTTIPANGGAAQILVKVYAGDDTTDVVNNVEVSFSTNIGSVQVQNELTDAGGYARAIVYAGSKSGSMSVTASIENYSNTISLIVTAGSGLVSATPSEILADGADQATIYATVVDSLGQPEVGALVQFVATSGTITAQSYSGSDGKAQAILRSIPSVTDVAATVTATAVTGKVVGVEAGKGASAAKTASNVLGATTVTFKGITVSGEADKSTVFANSADSTVVRVTVTETTSGDAVPDATVNFDTDLGELRESEVETDSTGAATVVFFGGNESGVASVTAGIANGLSSTVEITLTKQLTMKLTGTPASLSANGNDTATITALVTDADGNPVAGEKVYFSSTLGTILASAETDTWGNATVTLRSPRTNGVATVRARCKTVEKTTYLEFTGAAATLQATPLIAVSNGMDSSKITITLSDADDVLLTDERVTITTTLGTLISSDGKSTGTSIVDSTSTSGKVTAYLRSSQAGDATVTVTAAGVTETLTVQFTEYTFTVTADSSEALTGGSKTLVTAVLRDRNGAVSPLALSDVSFSTTLGSIAVVERTVDGRIVAELTSGNSAGTAIVTAALNDPSMSASTTVSFIAGNTGSIILTAERPSVQLGGNSISIYASVYDTNGNPKAGVTVTFSLLAGPGGGEGITPGSATTNEYGQAAVTFTSGTLGSYLDGVQIRAQAGGTNSNLLALTIAGEPSSILIGYGASYTTNGDGTYTLPVSASVLDVNANYVPDGTMVYFSIDSADGVVQSPVATVNSVASSQITYPQASAGKTVQLTASSGGKQGTANIQLPGFTALYIAVTASPTTIAADGKTTSQIRAVVFDKNGSSAGVPDGITVTFTTSGGTIAPRVAATVSGVATATLTSVASAQTASITAACGSATDVVNVTFADAETAVSEVATIDLDVSASSIPADGTSYSEVTATLRAFDGSVMTVPTTVQFSTDIGDISSSVRSSTDGTAVARFTSGTVGTATISATVGTVAAYTTVTAVPGDPHSINLSFDNTTVGVQGSGRNETLIIRANVKDSKNNAVSDGVRVKFELVGAHDTAVSLTPAGDTAYESSPIPTVNGLATVSFHSGTHAGTHRIKVTVVDSNGVALSPLVTSETTQFMVVSGPAFLDTSDLSDPFTNSRVTVAGAPLNIFAGELGTDDSKSTIRVLVSDRYNNPVPEGTAVYFTTTGGSIDTKTGFTDSQGMATVTLFAGNPFPTVVNSGSITNPNSSLGGPATFTTSLYDYDNDGDRNDGIAIITALTEGVDQDGDKVTAWNYVPVVFSLQVSTFTVVPASTSLLLGQSTDITITVRDVNGNPVCGGSKISVSSKLGTISTTSITTNSPGVTQYSVTLTNDLDPDNDTAGDTVVTVTVDSPNGGYSQHSVPIYMSMTLP